MSLLAMIWPFRNRQVDDILERAAEPLWKVEPPRPWPDPPSDLAERVRAAIEEFEKGCSNDGRFHLGLKIPEHCPECVRAFVSHLKKLLQQ